MEGDGQKPIEIRALVGSTEASFTGEILRKAFVAAESADEAKKIEGDEHAGLRITNKGACIADILTRRSV